MSPAPVFPPPSLATVTCVGASVRALAQSAVRAGWRVQAIDLFGDADLRAVAVSFSGATASDARYPGDLPGLIGRLPPSPWCYTGALENHPTVVARIAALRPLAGTPAPVLRAVRDPTLLGRAVRAAGLGFPDTHDVPDGLPTDGRFLVKPRASAGGHGIAAWHGQAARERPARLLWQRRVAGTTWSVAYACTAGEARLWGLSRQLIGRRWCAAPAFAYCGSVGLPLTQLATERRHQLERLGRLLTESFGLVGLVGADLIVDHRGGLHVIEVNPRPTASMELVERASGRSLAATHLAACGYGPPLRDTLADDGVWAKAVLFAARPLHVDLLRLAALTDQAAGWTADDGWPALADIPVTGTHVDTGRPLLTLFARADTAATALNRLRRRAAAVAGLVSAGEPTLR